MFSSRNVVPPALPLAAALVSACDDHIHPAPSPITPLAPSPAPDLSHLMGVWNLTLRLTDARGYGCVAETMQARIGEPNRYLLSVKQAGASTLDVTLSDASGDYSCNFTNVLAEHRWHRDRLAAVEVLRA